MKPMRKRGFFSSWVEKDCVLDDGVDDSVVSSAVSSLVARFRTFTRRGRSADDNVYNEGTCKLKAIIMWPLVETGLTFSR